MDPPKRVSVWLPSFVNTVSKVISQACTVESLSNSVQSSVSPCLKDIVNQFKEVNEQAKECIKPITA